MSKKFYAINRKTGEKWKKPKDSSYDHEYLVLYDSGYAAVVRQEFYTHIEPLDPKEWKVVMKDNLLKSNVVGPPPGAILDKIETEGEVKFFIKPNRPPEA